MICICENQINAKEWNQIKSMPNIFLWYVFVRKKSMHSIKETKSIIIIKLVSKTYFCIICKIRKIINKVFLRFASKATKKVLLIWKTFELNSL